MPNFSSKSLAILATCDPKLQRVLNEAIKYCDFSVLEGFRNQERQDYLFSIGQTKVQWPNGKHNSNPSKAVDVGPSPLDWKNEKRFIRALSFIQGVGFGMGIPLRLGGDWDGDFVFDESFYDWPHIELVG